MTNTSKGDSVDKTENVRLIFNEPDPSKGGIPRYAYRLRQAHNGEEIDFTEFQQGNNLWQKLWNNLYGRRRFLKKNHDGKKKVNHFVQPELYTPGLPGRDVVTVHDLFLFRDDQYSGIYGKGRKFFYKKRLKQAVKHADRFIAVSQQTKIQMINRLGISDRKIDVINLGFRDKFQKKDDVETDYRDKIGYLGDARGRKRVDKLLEDWKKSINYRITRRDIIYSTDFPFLLELAGPAGEVDFSEQEKRGDIKYRGFIPEEDLVNWYNEISALFIPSSEEGFGLPILEAVACHTPVYVYRDARITPELYEYVTRVESVSELNPKEKTEEELAELAEKARERFDWNDTIRKTHSMYRVMDRQW
jgi:glycosyltransferase involved in cell wall biosynthesis